MGKVVGPLSAFSGFQRERAYAPRTRHPLGHNGQGFGELEPGEAGPEATQPVNIRIDTRRHDTLDTRTYLVNKASATDDGRGGRFSLPT